jgi:DNA excision repair protein ERCC-5
MGVTGLWSIVQPCARPTKLETLNRKRLAVDASIWIYQFLKAVRDKEGNALRNSHVVGFFRRICKLLYFGIKPVFVFDGGAPALKRNVIRARKQRREGRRDDAARTAGKLLAVQMQRRAEQEEQKRKEQRYRPAVVEEEAVREEDMVYVDELQMTQQERQQNRRFRKTDAYHLPELDVSMNEMGGENDPRIMSIEELQAYARQFDTGEDLNVYDFSKIDYDSPFFTSLPASDRYNILNAARLRSRLRMGHSKEQLDTMFPDRMEFSKFQIERVTERNELTQRLMNINGADDMAFGINGIGRVSGEKGREYVLVKNDGVEGGWALGVVSNEGTSAKEAIDIDKPEPVFKDESEEEEFEDVAIEGLNRLPKPARREERPSDATTKQRQAFYRSRRQGTKRKPKRPVREDSNSLFIAEQPDEPDDDVEEQDEDTDLFGEGSQADEDEELKRAIAMSMQQDDVDEPGLAQPLSEEEDDMLEVFNQSAVEEAKPLPKGSGRSIANIVNKRAFAIAPESHEVTSFGVPAPRSEDGNSDSDEEAMDFQAALAESRRGKRKAPPPGPKFNNVQPRVQPKFAAPPEPKPTAVAKNHGFSGPLPFEKLDLGSSLLGKKKMEERKEETAGGFENPALAEKKKKPAEPLPPWFSGDVEADMKKQKEIENEDRRKAREFNKQFRFDDRRGDTLAHDSNAVIDLDTDDEEVSASRKTIDLDADEEQPDADSFQPVDEESTGRARDQPPSAGDAPQRLGDLADEVRARPPTPSEPGHRRPTPPKPAAKALFMEADSDGESDGFVPRPDEMTEDLGKVLQDTPRGAKVPFGEASDDEVVMSDADLTASSKTVGLLSSEPLTTEKPDPKPNKVAEITDVALGDEDEPIAWSESEDEVSKAAKPLKERAAEPAGGYVRPATRSPSADFEDVDMSSKARATPSHPSVDEPMFEPDVTEAHVSGIVHQEILATEDMIDDDYDDFSDPEDMEIMRALAQEAEEHARFTSELNNKPTAQNIADYETELKQLRNQQKKDRRDADEVTHIMITECQQLLRLFGLPYVTAPMEAEAQCAELVQLGLVDGIVTDDSDCFLFGGTRIYKNFFNQAKFVECYLASDFEKEFDLTRQKMIDVAHLLGSDYTEGLTGVGPVTALEILGEFPGLNDFKTWWEGVQSQTITKEDDKSSPFRKKFRRNATKLFLPPFFPDTKVNDAYTAPEVDSDPQPFQWGVPDLDALRSFLMATIGWSQERTDEVLVPVIRDMNRRMDEGTQANITKFFTGAVGVGAAAKGPGGESFAPRKRLTGASKRMGGALERMAAQAEKRRSGGRVEEDDSADDSPDVDVGIATDVQQTADASALSRATGRKRKQPAADEDVGDDNDGDASESEAPKRNTKKGRGRGGAKSARGRGKKAARAE